MRHLYFSFLFLFLVACSSGDQTNYKKSNEIINNIKKDIPKPWKEINSEASDYALENANTKSLFILNSACRKYESSNLNALTSSIVTGIENLNIKEKQNNFYQDRAAVEITASGALDGVKRFFKIITLHKNNCIYDYVLISTNENNLTEDTTALHQFIERIIIK